MPVWEVSNIQNLIAARNAVGEAVYIDPYLKEHRSPLFEEDEIERAETITNALKGLSIESAQKLLKKIDKYLLQVLLTEWEYFKNLGTYILEFTDEFFNRHIFYIIMWRYIADGEMVDSLSQGIIIHVESFFLCTRLWREPVPPV